MLGWRQTPGEMGRQRQNKRQSKERRVTNSPLFIFSRLIAKMCSYPCTYTLRLFVIFRFAHNANFINGELSNSHKEDIVFVPCWNVKATGSS